MHPLEADQVKKNSDRMRQKGVVGHSKQKVGNRWHNHCLEHVRTAAGAPAIDQTAYEAWKQVPEALRHTDATTPPPPGAPVYWRHPAHDGKPEGAGHIVVSRGEWSCNTNDFVRDGFLDIADIRDITKGWALQYLGWAEEVNGQRVLNLEQMALAHLPKDAKVSLELVQHSFAAFLSNSNVVTVKAALHAEGLLPLFWRGPKAGRTTRRGYAQWQVRVSTKGRRLADGIPMEADLKALGEKQGFAVVK